MLPLSVLFTLILIISTLWFKKDGLVSQTVKYIKRTSIYLIFGIIYIIIVIFQDKYEALLLKESLYFIYVWILIALFFIFNETKIPEDKEFRLFNRIFLLFTFILLIGFYYNLIVSFTWVGKIFNQATDYNYLSLGLLMAIPILIKEWENIKKPFWIIFGAIFMLAIFIPVIGSGSRRGIIFTLFIHIALVFYYFLNILKKKKIKIVSYYFWLLLGIIVAVFILVGTSSPQLRNLFVEVSFPNSQKNIKAQYTSVIYRYSTIQNDSSNYKALYSKLWVPKPFSTNKFADKFIAQQLLKKTKIALEKKNFNSAWNLFLHLPYFSENQNYFLKNIPYEYKKHIPTNQLLSDSIYLSPYLYPIPYVEYNFIDYSKLTNIIPVSNELLYTDRFKFITHDTNLKSQIESNLFLLPTTKNTISLTYKIKAQTNIQISFLDDQNNQINLNPEIMDSLISSGLTVKKITFKSPLKFSKAIKMILNFNLDSKDTLILEKSYHKRIPVYEELENNTILSEEFKRTPISLNLTKLDSAQKEQFLLFLEHIDRFSPEIRRYGNYGILVDKSDSSWTIESPVANNFSRGAAILPALSGCSYHIRYAIKTDKSPSLYLKRYPERNPFNGRFQTLSKSITFNEKEKEYEIDLKYKVLEAKSGLSFLVVGIENASNNEQFTISDFSWRIIDFNDEITIDSLQYKFLKTSIDKVIRNYLPNTENTIQTAIQHIQLKESAKNRLFNQQKKYFLELEKISPFQEDSLGILLNNEVRNIQFRPYGIGASLKQENINGQEFYIQENLETRIYAIIPAIKNLETTFDFLLNSPSKPEIWCKRFPERNPYTFNSDSQKQIIEAINDSVFHVKYSFLIKESNSGMGAIIIKIPPTKNAKSVTISNSQLNLKINTDSIYQINSFQYYNVLKLVKYKSRLDFITMDKFELNEIKNWQGTVYDDGKFLNTRIQRWKFAVFYFNQLSWTKKLFGAGFNYLNIYPIVFPENGTNLGPDYPHNPIISSFLYSGLLGGFFYIYFLGLSFYRYWRLRKELALFGLLYSLAFAFTFFSGNSHFSVPAFTLLSLLPFAFPIKKEQTNSLDKLEKQELSSKP